jgi:hypothetical protein
MYSFFSKERSAEAAAADRAAEAHMLDGEPAPAK